MFSTKVISGFDLLQIFLKEGTLSILVIIQSTRMNNIKTPPKRFRHWRDVARVAKTHLGARLVDKPLFSREFIDHITTRNDKFVKAFKNSSVKKPSVKAVSVLLYQWIDLLHLEEVSTSKLIVDLTSDVAAIDVGDVVYLDNTRRHSSLGIVCDKEIEEKTISLCRSLGRPVTREELIDVHTKVATKYGKLDVFQANKFDTRAIWRTVQRANNPRAMINSIERFHKRTAAQVEDILSKELNRRNGILENYEKKKPSFKVNSFYNTLFSLSFADFVVSGCWPRSWR